MIRDVLCAGTVFSSACWPFPKLSLCEVRSWTVYLLFVKDLQMGMIAFAYIYSMDFYLPVSTHSLSL